MTDIDQSKVPAHHQQWLETMIQAGINGDLGLMRGKKTATGEYRSILVIKQQTEEDEIELLPLGHFAEDNPFELYDPPVLPTA